MACVIQQRDCKQWFAELSVDMEKVRHSGLNNRPTLTEKFGSEYHFGVLDIQKLNMSMSNTRGVPKSQSK